MAVACMRNASGQNYKNSSFIVELAVGQIPQFLPQKDWRQNNIGFNKSKFLVKLRCFKSYYIINKLLVTVIRIELCNK